MIFKQKLIYTAFGAIIMFLGMIVTNLLTPIIAQNGTFGDITCTGVTVVDKNGLKRVRIGADEHGGNARGGHVKLLDDDGSALANMWVNEWGGRVNFFGRSNLDSALFGINRDGVSLDMSTNFFDQRIQMSCNSVDEEGSIQLTGGQDGKHVVMIFTKSVPNSKNPCSLEDKFFGITMFDFNKSNTSRANMFIAKDGRGGFGCSGPHDKPLWSTGGY